MKNRWDVIPADTFMEILRRLPPSPRRRLRLVCRHWRNVIDDRVPVKQARAKILAFAQGHGLPRAFVIDNITEKGIGRDLKLQVNQGTSMVGTCNGLLCLHHDNGNVVVVNPVTGEKLSVPPPSGGAHPPAISYSFAYHTASGQYKIVHLRCDDGDSGGTIDAVNVFTLGGRSWREVPVPVGTSCLLSYGLVSTGDATYWVATDAHTLMSFDLKDERVAFATKPPVRVVGLWRQDHLSCHLTRDVSGRLGLAVCSHEPRPSDLPICTVQVWMLEDQRWNKKRKWILLHKIARPGQKPLQEIAWPHATDGEHLFATRAWQYDTSVSLLAYRLGEARAHDCGVVQRRCAPPLPRSYHDCHSLRTFAHVETTEHLAVYRRDNEERRRRL